MTADAQHLAPCPFCGSEMHIDSSDKCARGPGLLYVSCDCGAMGAGGKTLPEAIAAWNRRAPTGQSRTPLSLSELDALARIYASNYASPHHFTLGVNGLRSLLEDATGQSRTFEAGEATCASNEPDEQDTASLPLPLPQPTGERE